MTTFPGYHLGETLYEGTRTLVYRGTRTTDSQPVVIKFLRNEYPSFNELVQFRNQYTIAKNLNLPGIVKPLALETYGNGYALVMADEGYISLGEWRKEQFSIADFLTIAVQLAEILHGLYQNRVIHKDIKPGNILIYPQSKQVKLIDFSISSLLPKETLQISNPNVLEGTLAYISPEQTGRMNRGIDYRTDFYSLGVTFYELLTGELPFQSNDPMELVHCHIAKSPIFPETGGRGDGGTGGPGEIPLMVLGIVLKLMAKNAEDRYQSALGLKYDLEKCLCQWKETGAIAEFELGERDICDRFIIPEKLYGRDKEVQTLLDAFERVATGNSEMMLVAGFSGIGKTAVVNEVHKPITRQHGYFIKGKFDQFNRNIPFSAFVSAFRSLMGQLHGESDANLVHWKAKIMDAVGENGQVIIDVIPELERIIGQQPPVPELSGGAAQNRFNLLFGKFVRVFTTQEHPLVLFLDDLQWADSASFNLLELLMNESETGYLLVLGAYRDNEVFPAHPLMLTLDNIQKQGATINTLTLAALDTEDITRLVADTLLCSTEVAAPLSELVYQKTQGNPFFTTQFLVGLHEDGCITFEVNAGYWQCDLAQVRQLALTDDVVEFMVARLQKLPEGTQAVLKLAACIGNQFDLGTLAVVCEDSQDGVAADLWCALQEGFVVPESETYKFFQGDECQEKGIEDVAVGYRFLHDRVQQAAYSLIAEEDKAANHYRLGCLLREKLSPEEQEQQIFEVVGQLNYGLSLISTFTERRQLSQLNFKAGRKARTATAYVAAKHYFLVGIQLLADEGWDTEPVLARQLHEEVAEIALLKGEIELVNDWLDTILVKTPDLLERMRAYELRLQVYQSQGQQREALTEGRHILKQLGIVLPETPTLADVQSVLERTLSLVDETKIAELIDLPKTEDKKAIASLKILTTLGPSAYQSEPLLFLSIACAAFKVSLQYGCTELSAPAYSDFGLAVSGTLNRPEIGYQFGRLAIDFADRVELKSIQCIAGFKAATFLLWNQQPIQDAIEHLGRSYIVGLEVGESLHTVASMVFSILYSYLSGKVPLDELRNKVVACNSEFPAFLNFINWSKIVGQSIDNSIGINPESEVLTGHFCDETELVKMMEDGIDRFAIHLFLLSKLILSYTFDKIAIALEAAERGVNYLEAGNSVFSVPVFYFYDALSRLAGSVERDSSNGQRVEPSYPGKSSLENSRQKLRTWAECAPMNFLHKYHLVEAEYCRQLGNRADAIEYYDLAISGAKANEFLQEEALANELAAKFYLNWGKEKIAQTYMVEAYYCYARWGAKAKTDRLEATYPQLLTPILQQPQSSLSLNATTTLTGDRTVRTSTTTSATTSILDISAAIKASQALSGEIELDALLSQLMHIVLENAGADKGAFVLNNGGTWEVVAECIKETCELSATPLDNAQTLPVSIVRAVGRTQQTILFDRADKDTRFASDTYLMQQQPKSLFCTPILNQSRLIGILYLENNLSAGAFTPERVEVLNWLTSQAAISIENARLYENAQAANKMLQKSLEDLKQAQLQLVQSEKMSALGNLVAGVAHEINNPVGFIGGNLQPTRDYVDDLLGLIDLYQEENPTPSVAIEEEIEAIDLDFLREDLPKLISSMKLGVDRIAHISTSLRTFSRTDKEHKVPFNLHEGIDSTFLILKHRLKANEQRPAIEIVKEYGNIPEVQCFPGQLNQVFMNLIANAIDALDEGNAGRSFEEISANPNRITIQTDIQDSGVTIRISDNGVGMPEEVKQRIFEQGFTTKGVGKGTGLGMAIARQIIEEKHGGTISCTSESGQGTEFTIDLP